MLGAGGFGGFRRGLSVRMNLDQREMAVRKTKIIAELGLHQFHRRERRLAVRALVIAVLD